MALHSIDQVLQPLSPDGPPSHKDPVLINKLLQGNAGWSTTKTILGWDLDMVAGTLTLPPHWLAGFYALLNSFPASRRCAPMAEWHQLLGELRSMEAALPGARGMFSTLQDALCTGDWHRIRITCRVLDSFADFRALADSIGAGPTRFWELIPIGDPVAVGACDACQLGIGGVWFRPLAPALV